MIRQMTLRKRAWRGLFCSLNSKRSMFWSKVGSGIFNDSGLTNPLSSKLSGILAYRAENTPGRSPKAATSNPVSSAKQSTLNFWWMYRAFWSAFPSKVPAVSGISSWKPSESMLSMRKSPPRTGWLPKIFWISSFLCRLWVAK